eukprot:14209-Pelagococcus_subviridis.AAC.1
MEWPKDDDVRVLRDAARGQGARFLRHAHQSVHRHGAPEGRGHARARHRERGGKAIRKRRRGLRQSAALGCVLSHTGSRTTASAW